MVNPAQVTGRRTLHFNSYEDVLADVHAMQASRKHALGNWSLGQVCEHLAKAIEYAIDGAPFRASWIFRMVGPWIKKRFIARPMKPGFQLPKSAAEYLPTQTEDAAGVARLEKAIQRWGQCSDIKPHSIFGPMTREEYDQLNFRHAEMHLSFIVPD
jgi:hypothetical protein